ncbi:hypothetical protein R5H30_17255 [Sulfitobacter sp. D35]|nr:hypothetical protein [Sulfitobacter sp. D35]
MAVAAVSAARSHKNRAGVRGRADFGLAPVYNGDLDPDREPWALSFDEIADEFNSENLRPLATLLDPSLLPKPAFVSALF